MASDRDTASVKMTVPCSTRQVVAVTVRLEPSAMVTRHVLARVVGSVGVVASVVTPSEGREGALVRSGPRS